MSVFLLSSCYYHHLRFYQNKTSNLNQRPNKQLYSICFAYSISIAISLLQYNNMQPTFYFFGPRICRTSECKYILLKFRELSA